MTDDLKNKFEQLVADPPPPSTVPSEAVFARVRTARRRRTAGALTLTAAAVVAVAFAVNNVTDIDGRPPVSNTPSVVAPTSTPPPSSTPTTTPTRTPSAPGTTGSTSVHVGAVHTPNPNTQNTNTNTPPPVSTSSSSNTPAAPRLSLDVSLHPTVKGRVVTVNMTAKGTVRVPVGDDKSGSFTSVLGSENYTFGDGQQNGSDAGTVNCVDSHTTKTGQQTRALIDWMSPAPTPPSNHTYTKAGTYKISYTVRYCGAKGWVPVTATANVTVK
ncbi:hypothetical protein [Kribbella sp. NPDC048928]|uniref:hypothetical protein n=1 Tax=Kribbella sp. NPDC048928 TaxID=3364111 RepID=UPI00370F998B